MPEFRRPPRIREVAETREVELPQKPPEPKHPARAPFLRQLLLTLLPALLPAVVLGLVSFVVGSSSTMVLMSVALGGSLSIAMVLAMIFNRRDEDARLRQERDEYERRREGHERALQAIFAEADAAVRREAKLLARTFPAPGELAAEVSKAVPGPRLWERRPADDDFLELRLGLGQRTSCRVFRGGDPAWERSPEVQEAVERLEWHQAVPVTVQLAPEACTGIAGGPEALNGVLNALIAQAAALHSPAELRLALVTADGGLADVVKWLPHCRAPGGGLRHLLIARTPSEATALLRALPNEDASDPGVRYLLVVDLRGWRGKSPVPVVSKHVSVVALAERVEHLPADCGVVVDLRAPARVRRHVEAVEPGTFVPDRLERPELLGVALAQAPLTGGDASTGDLPREARLVEVLGRGALEAAPVLGSWRATRGAIRLAAPIGPGRDGAPVVIDLRRDGPHGLVAGTTGSGKSEFLQSLVAAFAVRVPPDALNFLLVDYKGGAAFSEIRDLPHVVGVVTDLDAQLAERALTSLRAELHRRERLLASVRPAAANIAEYERGNHAEKIPNLVIIIDEFHRLVSEQPEFIDEMVTIAQQGRSLGVHLILSTQKPSGVVTEHIRANTNLRVCLRVTDEADSRDVLGMPDAAFIPREAPGRLLMRVGTERPVAAQAGRISGFGESRRVHLGTVGDRPIYQSMVMAEPFLEPLPARAYSRGVGARLTAAAEDEEAEGVPIDERKLLVESVVEAARRGNIPQQQPPWQPHLPARIEFECMEADAGRALTVGLLDEPERQAQRPFMLDIEAGHVLIAGAANAGKTEALLTIAAAAARQRPPSSIHLYGIDFGGGDLRRLERLPHCGGVAGQTALPQVRWLLQFLRDTVLERLSRGIRDDDARILVLVDNFPAFTATVQSFDGGAELYDELLRVFDVGRAARVSFALTAERPEGVRAAFSDLVESRIGLYLPQREAYLAIGLKGYGPPGKMTPGRGVVPGDPPHEVQFALTGVCYDVQPEWLEAGGPVRITPLPDHLAACQLQPPEGRGIALGLREGRMPWFTVPVLEHLVVLGPRASGRTNVLALAAGEARRQGAELAIVNPRRAPALRALTESGGVARYAEQPGDVSETWQWLEAELTRRRTNPGDDPPLLVVVDDLDVVEADGLASPVLETLVLRGADARAALYVSADTRVLKAQYNSQLVRMVLSLRRGLLLAPESSGDLELLGAFGRVGRLPPGRALWISGGSREEVQVAHLACGAACPPVPS